MEQGQSNSVSNFEAWNPQRSCLPTLPATRPRFLPFEILPRRPLGGVHGRRLWAASAESESPAGRRDSVDRGDGFPPAGKAITMVPSRSEPCYKSNEDGQVDIRPRTTLGGGGSTNSSRIRGECHPISSASPRTPRRIRPPPRQPKAFPGKYRQHAGYKLTRSARKPRPPPGSTTRDQPRPGCSSGDGGGCRSEESVSLGLGLAHAESCSAVVREEAGIGRGASSKLDDVPFMATPQDEETASSLMYGGLLWRESGFGRETELITLGVPQGLAEACRPVRT